MKLADLYVPSSPKYLALADAVERGVAGGLLAPGEALPTQPGRWASLWAPSPGPTPKPPAAA